MERTFIEENRPSDPSDSLKSKLGKVNPVVSFFLNRRNQLTLFVWVFTLSVPILFYYFLFHKQIPIVESVRTCSVNSTFRVPCGNFNLTEGERSRSSCLTLSCCFDESTAECFHSIPSAYFYTTDNKPSQYFSTFLTKMDPNFYVSCEKTTNSISVLLSNVTKGESCSQDVSGSTYVLKQNNERNQIEILRSETKDLLLTTSLGPLISTENYLEVTFYLGQDLFGLDQLYITGNETIRKVIYHNTDDHTTSPNFLGYKNGFFHSLSIEYSGPLEILILPSRLIVIRAIGKRSLSFRLHTGPTPKDIAQFYYDLHGYQTPDRWVLGPHICRGGNSTLKEALEKYENFDRDLVKYSSDCFHENLYFMLMEPSIEDDLRLSLIEALANLKEKSKFIMSIHPHIPIKTSLKADILFMRAEGDRPQNGSYFGLEVVYPDYSDEKIPTLLDKLTGLFEEFQPEGYSFNSNWAPDESDFYIGEMKGFVYTHENISKAIQGTLLWNSTRNFVKHLFDHNNYGKYQIEAYDKIAPNKRFLSSTFSTNSDTIVQVEKMNGTWANLKRSLNIVMTHGIFAHPLISVPICGSTKHFDVEDQIDLCIRWYIMGATMPIFQISSEPPLRDPSSLNTSHARNLTLKAIETRESLSLYYHTILNSREPIVRPTFYEFYKNITTFSLDEQYMVGDALLVAQPFLKDSYLQRVYLPEEARTFYEFFGGKKYEGEQLGWITLTAVSTDWFIFIRGGKIVPLLKDNTYSLAIALLDLPAENETETDPMTTATGSLNLDGKELHFKADKSAVIISNINEVKSICGETEGGLPSVFSSIVIYGLEEQMVTINHSLDLCADDVQDEFEIPFNAS